MSNAAEVLVIIVSAVLAVFLIVAIILAIYLIRLSAEVRRIAEAARNTVEHIDSAVVGVSHFASPMFIADLVGRQIKKFTSNSKKRK